MLPGIATRQIERHPDERGSFTELLRQDWKELLGEDSILQANLSHSYPGIIRAWHRHTRGQNDYFLVIKGSMKICAYDDNPESETRGELMEIIASGEKLQITRIPGNYWHGTKTLGDEPSLTIDFTNRLYDYSSPDEERRPWNDPAIVPRSINGRSDDPRVGKPWDWNRPPYK